MPIRGRNAIRDFLEGFNGTYGTFQKVAQDWELQDIAKAKPEDVMAPAATMVGMVGVAPDASGAGSQYDQADAPMVASKVGTKFLGKTYDTAQPDAAINDARNLAMAGVYKKYGNFAEGLRLEQQAQQAQRQATADARDAQRFGWDQARATREQVQAKIADDKQASMAGIDRNVGDWMKTRLAGPVGQDGTPAPSRAPEMADYMAATQRRAALLQQAGHAAEAGKEIENYRAQMHGQLMLETEQRNQALGQAASGLLTGNTQPMVDAFNKFIPDGSRVLSAVVDKKTGMVAIKRETMDGAPLPDSVKSVAEIGAALEAFKNPGAVAAFAEQNFRNDLALRADSRAEKSLGIQGRQANSTIGLHDAMVADIEQKTKDKKAITDARTEYAAAIDAGDKDAEAKASKKILAFLRSGRGAEHLTPLEARARLYLESGEAKTLTEALKLANQKVQESPAQTYDAYGKPQAGIVPAPAQVDAALAARAAWLAKQGLGADAPPVPNQSPAAKYRRP